LSELQTLAVIPARGGSKGIPDKNLATVGGRPLIGWALESALRSHRVDQVVVATDAARIGEVALECAGGWGLASKLSVHARSTESATDAAPTEHVLLEVLEQFPAHRMLLLQATSPLVATEDVDAIAGLLDEGFDSALTCVSLRRFVWRQQGSGAVEPVNYDPARRPRRQEHAGVLMENGAVYGFWSKVLRTGGARLGGRIGVHVMADESFAEIDEPLDLLVVDHLVRALRLAATPNGRLASVKGVVFDFDGVLTDDRVLVQETGAESVMCSRADGLGIDLIRQLGLPMAVISTERNGVVGARCRKLGLECYHGVRDKAGALRQLVDSWGLGLADVAFVGNERNDLEALALAGLSVCPRDAHPSVRATCALVLERDGGRGAVRELAQLLADHGCAPRERARPALTIAGP